MRKRGVVLSLILTIFFALGFINSAQAAASDKGVYVIPVKGDIGPSVENYVSDQLKKAEELNIDIIIFDINTLGGRVDSTLNIQQIVKDYSSKFKFYSYINNKAESAGVMIALLGEKIFMTSDATIGSASVIPFDEKSNSAWSSMLKAQAESKGKSGDIAKATADYNIVIPGIKEKGSLLNMTAKQAVDLKFADGVANSVNDVAKLIEYRGDKIITAEKDFKVTLSEIISNPYVSMFLLLIGIIALIAEIFIPSFGILGTLGTVSILVYFLGNIFAGHASWWAMGIFAIGVILVIIELNVPGFGAPGIGGVIFLSIAIVMSAETTKLGLMIMILSWIIAGIGIFLFVKYGIKKGPFAHMVLKSSQGVDEYVSYDNNYYKDLLNKEGISKSPLRPSGSVVIDNEVYDVQTLGEFVKEGTPIKVIKVEGNKIIVKSIN